MGFNSTAALGLIVNRMGRDLPRWIETLKVRFYYNGVGA